MSRALRIATAAALLVAVAILGLYAVTHAQIRRIAPPLPSVEALRSLLEHGGAARVGSLVIAQQPSDYGALSHTAFVAQWPDGRIFLVDTGMDADAAADFARIVALMGGGGEETWIGTAAEQLGATQRAQVAGVGITHLHIDHTQGIGALCAGGVRAALYQTPWQAERHNIHTLQSAAIAADSCLTPQVLGEEPLATPDGFPGLGVVALGGHTPGSTLFAVAHAGHLWLLAGDITNSKADLRADRGKGFVYSILQVPEHTGRMAQLRQWLRALDAEPDMTVVVAHDVEAARADGLPPWGG